MHQVQPKGRVAVLAALAMLVMLGMLGMLGGGHGNGGTLLGAAGEGAAGAADTGGGVLAPGKSRCGNVEQRPWCDTTLSPRQRTALLLGRMTLAQKASLLAGDDPAAVATGDPYTGISKGITELGIPDLRMSDGPVGFRGSPATALPIPLSLGASFNPSLARRVGAVIGQEIRLKGNDLVHGPVVDVMRNPLAGRTFETYGEDPYLAGQMGVQWTLGAQSQGVLANVKHYIMNNQEGQVGVPPLTSLIGGRQLVNAVIDERTLREIYLQPFADVVRDADVASVMCAYNLVNGAPSCSNRHLLHDVLRGDWGFDGFVLSDYLMAVKDTINSLNNGTEIEMPLGMFYTPALIEAAVGAGLVSAAVIDERVGNILRTLFRFGFFDRANYVRNDAAIDRQGDAQVARDNVEQGTVLMQNSGVLPIDAGGLTSIAVIGKYAQTRVTGGGSSAVVPFDYSTPLAAITRRAGKNVQVTYNSGSNAQSAAVLAAHSDVAIVFVADSATEGVDKTCLALDCPQYPIALLLGIPDPTESHPQDDLITAVAAANPATIVVMQTAGPVLTPWRDQVAALLDAWYPGQEAGAGIARVLFGDTDPGGRLPVSFPAAASDTPVAGDLSRYPGIANQVQYSEGVFIGYRWFDEFHVAPAFAFGEGLSYTHFALDGLRVEPAAAGPGFVVHASLKNIGARAGWAVAQLYLGLPSPSAAVPQPPHALKGFAKHWLQPGASVEVSLPVDRQALSWWDDADSRWRVADGCYKVDLGFSSRDLPLTTTLRVAGDSVSPGDC